MFAFTIVWVAVFVIYARITVRNLEDCACEFHRNELLTKLIPLYFVNNL
jgi:hypothetical protein